MRYLKYALLILLAQTAFAGIQVQEGDTPTFAGLFLSTDGVHYPDGSLQTTAATAGSGPSGQINLSAQFALPYYSVAGSSNVLSGATVLVPNRCMQSDANGLPTSANAACGSGGGGSGLLYSSFTATAPIIYNNTNGAFSLGSVSLSTGVTGILPVASGGSGTSTPGLIAGTNITSITGSWPNQTINATTQSGGGGSGNIVNTASQGSGAFYSAAGSSNTISGTSLFSVFSSSLVFSGPTYVTNISTLSLGPNTAIDTSSGVLNIGKFLIAGNYGTTGQIISSLGPGTTPQWITTLPGSQVGAGVPAANIASGSLGASVLASSFPVSGATAGSYTNSNITVNAQGIVTAASNGVGGGGGASLLAVTTGTQAGFSSITSSPTAVINFNNVSFNTSLQGGATVFVSLVSVSTTVVTGTTYSVKTSDSKIFANPTANAITVTLPTAVGVSGKTYTVKLITSVANNVTIATTGGQTIDGSATIILYLLNSSVDMISDGSNWNII